MRICGIIKCRHIFCASRYDNSYLLIKERGCLKETQIKSYNVVFNSKQLNMERDMALIRGNV